MKTTTIKYTCDRCGVALSLRGPYGTGGRNDGEPRPVRGATIGEMGVWAKWAEGSNLDKAWSRGAWLPGSMLDLCLSCGASLAEWFIGEPMAKERMVSVQRGTKKNPTRTVMEKRIRPDLKE